MNAEKVVCCHCLLCTVLSLPCRPRTEHWHKLVYIKFTTRCQTSVGTQFIGSREGYLKPASTNYSKKSLSSNTHIRFPDLVQSHDASPRACLLLRLPSSGSVLSSALIRLVLRSAPRPSFVGWNIGPSCIRLIWVGPSQMSHLLPWEVATTLQCVVSIFLPAADGVDHQTDHLHTLRSNSMCKSRLQAKPFIQLWSCVASTIFMARTSLSELIHL
jgi:hypothetical protein